MYAYIRGRRVPCADIIGTVFPYILALPMEFVLHERTLFYRNSNKRSQMKGAGEEHAKDGRRARN
jgi:hypothetical protein